MTIYVFSHYFIVLVFVALNKSLKKKKKKIHILLFKSSILKKVAWWHIFFVDM